MRRFSRAKQGGGHADVNKHRDGEGGADRSVSLLKNAIHIQHKNVSISLEDRNLLAGTNTPKSCRCLQAIV